MTDARGGAGDPGADTAGAAAAAQAFLDALAAERWLDAVRLLDGRAVKARYREWLELASQPLPDWSAEALMRSDPDMPREVAEWQAQELRRHQEAVGPGAFGGLSQAELRALTPHEAMARHLEAEDPRVQLRRLGEDDRLARGEVVHSGGPPTGGRVLGVVAPGPGMAIAVFSGSDDGPDRFPDLLFLLRGDRPAPFARGWWRRWRRARRARRWSVVPPGMSLMASPAEAAFDLPDAAPAREAGVPEDGSPGAVVEAVGRALHDRSWSAAARLVDPATVERWHRREVERKQAEARHLAEPPTAERLMEWDPALPEAVARYRAEQMRRVQDEDPAGFAALAGPLDTLSASALAGLAPEEAFVQAMTHPGRRRYDVVGELVMGEVAHVVYREIWPVPGEAEDVPDPPLVETRVATLRRTPDGWRMAATDPLFIAGSSAVFLDGEQQ